MIKKLNFSVAGGLEFNATRCVRMAEVTANDASVDVTLGAHQFMGLKAIAYFFCLCHLTAIKSYIWGDSGIILYTTVIPPITTMLRDILCYISATL